MSTPAPPISTIRDVVAKSLPGGHPTLTTVAKQLGISPRTLQRRLADAGLSYSQLVNQTRVAKACQLLSKRDLNISEIARRTGFATPSGFSRAFHTWTGKSPRAFREGL